MAIKINPRPSIFIALSLALLSCTAPAPAVRVEHLALAREVTPGRSLEELEAGRALLLGRCGACHGVPRVRERRAAEWTRAVDAMRGKAKLTRDEEALLRAYLAVAAHAAFVPVDEGSHRR